MTISFNKCKTCQVWKDTRGRGSKACLKCNPFREELQTIKPLDTIPDDIIEQYPDLQGGRIKSSMDGIAHLNRARGTPLCQSLIMGMSDREIEQFWASQRYLGYSHQQINNIVKEALEILRKIVKK